MDKVPQVVLVDDDPAVLRALHRTLRLEPLNVRATTSVAQVLDWLKSGDVDLLIVDQRMPDMPGTELIARARGISPRTSCVILSAFPDAAREAERRHVFVQRVLRKPWSDTELRALVRTLAQASIPGARDVLALDCEGLGDRDVLELARVHLELCRTRAETASFRLVRFGRVRGSMTRLLKSFVALADGYDRPVSVSDDLGCVPIFMRTLGSSAPKVLCGDGADLACPSPA